jgi:hypothetical protein
MRTKGLFVTVALLAAMLAAGAGPAAASPEAEALAAEVAAPWTSLQAANGAFGGYEPVGASARYGEAVMGLGLLQAGVRDENDALVGAGLAAISYVLTQDPAVRGASAFENWGLAAAYNVARRQLRRDARFLALRSAWRSRLRALTPIFLSRPRGGFFNKHLVEAVSWLELAHTGLRSRVRGSVLRRPRRSRARAIRYLVRDLPRLTDRSRSGNLRLLADPRPSPLAYHALSFGFYARSLSLLDRGHRRRAGRILLQAARASLSAAAPDGDVAYTGRSQEQSWALAFTAYGAEVAAARTHGRRAGALRRLAARTLARLRALHPVTARGIAVVPAAARGYGRAGLDPYADGTAYTGLTLVGLDWAAARHRRPLGTGGPVRQRRGYARLRTRGGGFAVVRTPRVWFAVRRSPDPRGDLRSDSGLVALKVRTAFGFLDVLPLRPRAFEPGAGAGAGPILLGPRGAASPAGRRLWASRRGARVDVGWARIRWRPLSCGVRARWRGPRSAAYEYSAFFPSGDSFAQVSPYSVVGSRQRVSVSGAASVSAWPGYSSATDGPLTRLRIRFAAGRSGRAAVTVCAV